MRNTAYKVGSILVNWLKQFVALIPRYFVRSLLITALMISIWVIIAAFQVPNQDDPGVWAAIAGSLAVITSVISSWGAQRVLELQQDAQQPYPYPTIDVKSRYGLMQLRVTNYGGSVARDIRITWGKPIINHNGEQIRFTKQENAPDIPVLLPGESVAIRIDQSHDFFDKNKDANFFGNISFINASNIQNKHNFYVSAERYRHSPRYDEEETKTHYEVQKIPKGLARIGEELGGIRSILDRRGTIADLIDVDDDEEDYLGSQGQVGSQGDDAAPSDSGASSALP